jgi:hypothetical protein
VITSAQAVEYLESALGVGLPSFFVDAAVAKVATAESAMVSAGYSAQDQMLIQCMAVAIIASAGAPRRIQSQGAPSGASRSFKNMDGDLSALRRSLASLDTAGTVADLIGPDPLSPSLFMVV